ncbi:hypothetical protein DEJ48_38915 [Streptomyces venezuelae]|uniref:Uncharacterized protein n=1 Tax=Streptomyces venezuelae TaxID=54571 RepID=A0A5P2CB32_STRVZ|nr:hypothetical protein [Streptomyces venezuelae]QES38591.1 hypothetical protein DEJ48_38915 [Streptomyces venezuelae]
MVLLDPGTPQQAPSHWLGPRAERSGTLEGDWLGPFPPPFLAAEHRGVALTTLAADKGPRLLAAQLIARRGQFRLHLAFGTPLQGNRVRWDQAVDVGELSAEAGHRLVGLAAGHATGGRPTEIVALLAVPDAAGDETLSYRLGRLSERGRLTVTWADPLTPPPTGPGPVRTAGVALHDLDGDGRDDLLLVASHSPLTDAAYWIGSGLGEDGVAAGWQGPFPAAPSWERPAGLCLGLLDAGRPPAPAPLGSPSAFVDLLSDARRLWLARAASPRVPFVGRGDPGRTLLDILAHDAHATSLHVRRLMGPDYLQSLSTLMGSGPLPDLPARIAARCDTQLMHLGLAVRTRLDSSCYADTAVEWTAPWIQSGPLSETEPLTENYLRWAATVHPQALHGHRGIADSSPLLLRLVRHATLRGYADAALRLVPPPMPADRPPWHEPELVDLFSLAHPDADPPPAPPRTLTAWRYIGENQQGRDLGGEIQVRSNAGDGAVADVTELRDALRLLADRPTAALHRLLAETLDLSGHRLDAWITAVATSRLRALRAQRPTGIQLGGYGWTEDLVAADADAAEESAGFVHAPSLAHATTAALLRGGHLSHRGTPAAETFAVDLSSARVRAALELLDGIRAGQSLGTLLGQVFERALVEHPDLPLARHLGAFRQLCPSVAGKRVPLPEGVPADAVAARSVCDGLALLRLHQKSAIPWGETPPGLPEADSTDAQALKTILDALGDRVDAVADLGVAEAVHQTASGRPVRAGAVLDALNRGELPPPEIEVSASARSGIGVTHRVLVLLAPPDPDDPAVRAWSASRTGGPPLRARAEPRLDAWAARLLGDPARVTWQAQFPGPGGDLPDSVVTFTLGDLGLCPLDVLSCPGAEPGGDLERRMLLHAVRHAPAGWSGPPPRLRLGPAAGPGSRSVRALLEVARAVRDLVGGGRPLRPADLVSGSAPDADAGRLDLARRLADAVTVVKAAVAALRALFAFTDPAAARAAIAGALGVPVGELGTMDNLLDLPAGLDIARAGDAAAVPARSAPEAIRDALLALADCAVQGAVPRSAADGDAWDVLSVQTAAVGRECAGRLDAARRAADPATGLTELLGADTRILPTFAPPSQDYVLALAERRRAGDATAGVTAPWLAGFAEVREGVGRLDRALLCAEAHTESLLGGVDIAQLPLAGDTPERWAGLEPAAGKRLPGGRLSLALHTPLGPPPAAADATVSGLAVDDWVEVVPNNEETTAVAFHYDNPGNTAPQALLLAVPPVVGQPWDTDTLQDVLAETIDLARVRAVDPDALPDLGQYLPALMLACNVGGDPQGDTISTQAPIA